MKTTEICEEVMREQATGNKQWRPDTLWTVMPGIFIRTPQEL